MAKSSSKQQSLHADQLGRMLGARTPADVESLLKGLIAKGYTWTPVGNDPSNAGRIHLAGEPSRPVIERSVNAIDGVLESKFQTDPHGNVLKSPREAAEKWFGIHRGQLSSLTDSQRQTMAENIVLRLSDSGIPKRPNVSIRDKGIGIHPDEMQSTILALGGSNKLSKFYLCGAYGQGGSTAYGFCEYSILASRRQPSTLNLGQPDEVAWTIIKRETPSNMKNDLYVYLVQPDMKVPRLQIDAEGTQFEPGTYVTHIAYELGKYAGRMTLVGYRLLNFLLFDPILPLWFEDERYNNERRSIAGNVARLKDNKHVEYENEYTEASGLFAGLRIRYWVMKVKPREAGETQGYHLDSYLEYEKSPKSVVVTLNGQVHGLMDKGFLKSKLELSFLSRYLLIQIETDNITNDARRQLFASTRERIREGERHDLLLEKLEDVLREDPKIKELENKRREQFLAESDTSADEKVKRLLDKLIITDHQVVVQAGGGGPSQKVREFKPRDPPKLLEIVNRGEPLEVHPGDMRVITLRTDAPDDYLTRPKKRGTLAVDLQDAKQISKIHVVGPTSGIIRVTIRANPNAPIGSIDKLRCVLTTHKKKELVAERGLIVSSPPPAPPTFDPPTEFEFANPTTPLELKKGRKAVVHIKCNGPDGYLTRPQNIGVLTVELLGGSGSTIGGQTDLRGGRIMIYLNVPKEGLTGATDKLTAMLSMPDGTSKTIARDCILVDAPPGTGPGQVQQAYRPNYKIIPVQTGDENWSSLGWDDKVVGDYEISNGQLLLYVSVGYQRLNQELDNKKLMPERLAGFKAKYQALVAYHLWQHHRDHKDDKTTIDPSALQEEYRRTANTILLATKPESELELEV